MTHGIGAHGVTAHGATTAGIMETGTTLAYMTHGITADIGDIMTLGTTADGDGTYGMDITHIITTIISLTLAHTTEHLHQIIT